MTRGWYVDSTLSQSTKLGDALASPCPLIQEPVIAPEGRTHRQTRLDIGLSVHLHSGGFYVPSRTSSSEWNFRPTKKKQKTLEKGSLAFS